MPLYLSRFSYTPETWAGLIRNPEDRRKAAQSYIESVGGKLHGRDSIGDRPHRFYDSALEGKDMLHVPLERGRHAHEAHRFGSGGAIEHDHVVALFAAKLVDVHEGAKLFHAREDGELLGLHVANAGGAQYGNHVGGDFAPVPLDLLLDIDFVDGEVVVNLQRVAGLGIEEAGLEVKGIGQAVRRIDAHHQGSIAELGKLQSGSSGQTRLTDTPLAAEKQDAHDSF